jgi:hypothetical protein
MRNQALLALAATAVLALPVRAGDHRGKVPWVDDPTAGLAQAHREGKVAMLFFSAEW